MTPLFLILIALALAAGFVAMVTEDPGYVLITIQPWSVELSLALFLLLILVLFLVLYLCGQGIGENLAVAPAPSTGGGPDAPRTRRGNCKPAASCKSSRGTGNRRNAIC